MNILVVGAGYLGAEICYQLRDTGANVFAARRSGEPCIHRGITFSTIKLDISEPRTFFSLPESLDAIFYCVSADDYSVTAYRTAYQTGVENLLLYVKENIPSCGACTFISSTGVYVENSGGVVSESSLVAQEDEIYQCIINGENTVSSLYPKRGLVLRFSGIYGPGRTYFVEMAKKLHSLSQDEVHWSNRIHVVDGARAAVFLYQNQKNGLYNVSDTLPTTKGEVATYIRSLLSLPPVHMIERQEEVPITQYGKKCDISKLLTEGFSFKYPTYREGYAELLS